MPRVGDKRSPEEVKEALEQSRNDKMAAVIGLAFDLLDAGFPCWIDIHQITDHGDFWAMVVLDNDRIDGTRTAKAIAIAKEHNADPHLEEVRMNQQSFSRLAFWPRIED